MEAESAAIDRPKLAGGFGSSVVKVLGKVVIDSETMSGNGSCRMCLGNVWEVRLSLPRDCRWRCEISRIVMDRKVHCLLALVCHDVRHDGSTDHLYEARLRMPEGKANQSVSSCEVGPRKMKA